MHTGKFVFAQVMDHLPMYALHRSIDRYDGHRFVKSFRCRDRFRSMAFAQLTSRESLRDIETCLGVQGRKLFHMGASCTIIAVPAAVASLRRVRRGSDTGLRGLRGIPARRSVAECRIPSPVGRRPRKGGRAVPFRGGVGGVRRCRWRGVRR